MLDNFSLPNGADELLFLFIRKKIQAKMPNQDKNIQLKVEHLLMVNK